MGIQARAGVLLLGKVTVDIRYIHGLTEPYTDADSKNCALQASVGYPIPLH